MALPVFRLSFVRLLRNSWICSCWVSRANSGTQPHLHRGRGLSTTKASVLQILMVLKMLNVPQDPLSTSPQDPSVVVNHFCVYVYVCVCVSCQVLRSSVNTKMMTGISLVFFRVQAHSHCEGFPFFLPCSSRVQVPLPPFDP